MDNGGTVVFGGLYEHSNRNDVRRDFRLSRGDLSDISLADLEGTTTGSVLGTGGQKQFAKFLAI